MTYILNPVWFYWIGVMDSLQTVVIISLVLSAVAFGTAVLVYFVSCGYGSDAEMAKKVLKVSAPSLVISALLLVFLPAKETLIEMQIAKFATYENAEWTVDTIKSAVDYIVEAMKSLN